MSRADVIIPRVRWQEYFKRVSREAAGAPTVVETLNPRRADSGLFPMPLRHIAYDAHADEIVIAFDGALTLAGEVFPRHLRYPVAVSADAPEVASPTLLIVRLVEPSSPVAVLLHCRVPAAPAAAVSRRPVPASIRSAAAAMS